MKTLYSYLILLVFSLSLSLTWAQTVVVAPAGTVLSSPQTDSRAIGWAGGKTWVYTNSSWPAFASPCYTFGYPNTITGVINGYNTTPPAGPCANMANLTYNAAQSNLAGGIVVYTGTTNYYDVLSGLLNLNVRLTFTFTNGASAAIPVINSNGYNFIKVTQNFNVNAIIEANYGSWTPVITLFDNLHTDPNSSICTSLNQGSFLTFSVNPTATNTSPSCSGVNVGLNSTATADATGAISYVWRDPSNTVISSSQNTTLTAPTPANSGIYTLYATDAIGCVASSPTTVTVNPFPTPVVTGTSTACGSVTLTASGGTSYLWSDGQNTAAATFTSSGAYTVNVTSAAGCTSTSAVQNVTVNPLPSPSVSGTLTACGSVTLTASGGTSYLWSDGQNTATATFTSTGAYTVDVTNAAGCTATSSVQNVTVNPYPTPAVSGTTTACGSVTLTASGGTSYLWSDGQNTAAATFTSSGAYTVNVTSAAGCTSTSAVQNVTVNPLPTPVVTGTLTACGSVTLTASGGTSYLWSDGQNTAAATFTSSGAYTVNVTSAAGCTSTSAVQNVTVNPLPSPSVSGTLTACGSVTLTASGGTSYLWSDGQNTAAATFTSSGAYTVDVTSAAGCTSTSAVQNVTVNPLPTPVVTGTLTACGSVTLTASGGTSYLWSDGQNTAAATFTSSGAYTVNVTSAAGCTSTSSVQNVTVNPLPSPSVSGALTACGSVTLTASGGTSYLWSDGQNTASANFSTSGAYTVSVTDALGCTATSAVQNVTVNPYPTPVVTGTLTACGSITLTASGGTSYLWSDGQNTATATFTSSGAYTVDVTSAAGCTSTSSVQNVTVNPLPTPVVTGTLTACGSVTLTASGGTSYLWSDGQNTAAATFTSSGAYTVNVTNALGCTATSSTQNVTVNPYPVPVVTGSLTACGTVTLTASGGTSYLWSDGQNTAIANFTSDGAYTVAVTSAAGCTATSAIQNVSLTPPLTRAYINAAVASSGDGSSWATAFKTLQEGLDACGTPNEIWVAAGTYRPSKDPFGNSSPSDARNKTFYLRNGVKIYGGFNGTETLLSERNWETNTTILSGDLANDDIGVINNNENAYHVILSVSDDNTTEIDGFIVEAGNADDYLSYGNIVVETKSVLKNFGGGMYNFSSSPQIRNMVFRGNNAFLRGGGIVSQNNATPDISNSTFSDNTATNGAGMANIDNASPVLNTCTFAGNIANGPGGGMDNYSFSSPSVTNCTFTGNLAGTNGGGMNNSTSASPILFNNTFFDNTATGSGGAIFNFTSSSPTIKNCILWGNTNTGMQSGNASNPLMTYTLTQDGTAGTGNINANPNFTNQTTPIGGDNKWRTADDGLQLGVCSPAVDVATNTGAPALDILGNALYNAIKDMGAYEKQSENCPIYSSSPSCQSASVANVSGSQWFYFTNASGQIAAINPNGMNMGTVTVEVSDSVGIVHYNGHEFLGRTLKFSSSNYGNGATMPTNYSLRVFYYDTELTEYNTATSGAYTPADFNMAWRNDGSGCGIGSYTGGVHGLIPAVNINNSDYGTAGIGFYLEFNLNHFTIFAATTSDGEPVPIELLFFKGTHAEEENLLSWATASEYNNDRFEIERSIDGNIFERIGSVKGVGSSAEMQEYSYTDKHPLSGVNYYRLKQVDFDGTSSLSDVITLFSDSPLPALKVYPNPSNTPNISIELPLGTESISIWDALGRQIYQQSVKDETLLEVELKELAAGVYTVKALKNKIQVETVKFVKE